MKTQLIQEKNQRPALPSMTAFKPPATLTSFKAPMTDTKERPMSSSFYGTQYNAQKSLTVNIEQMDAAQLRERLLVAETLMKNLYARNKELEGVQGPGPAQPDLLKELEAKQQTIEALQRQVQARQVLQEAPSTYAACLEEQLAEAQAECRRMLSKYSEARAFAYSQLEARLREEKGLAVYKQLVKRDKQIWESDMQHKAEALEKALAKCKLLSQEQEVL